MSTELVVRKPDDFYLQRIKIMAPVSDERALSINLPFPDPSELKRMKQLAIKEVSIPKLPDLLGEETRLALHDRYQKLYKKVDSYSDSITYLNHLATLAEYSGELQEALTWYRKAAATRPDPFIKHKILRNLFLQQDFSGVLHELQDVESTPDAFAALSMAYFLIAQRRFGDAEKQIDTADQLDPNNHQVKLLAGVLQMASGRFADAIRSFRSAAFIRPTSSHIFLNMALAYLGLGIEGKALMSARRAVALNPVNESSVLLYASILQDLCKYDEAINVLRNFINFDGQAPRTLERLAHVFLKAGDYDAALEYLKRQAGLDESPAAYNNIAVCYWKKKLHDKALKYFNLAIDRAYATNHVPSTSIKNLLNLLMNGELFRETYDVAQQLIPHALRLQPHVDEDLVHARLTQLNAAFELQMSDIDVSDIEAVSTQNISRPLCYEVLTFLLYYFASIRKDKSKAIQYAERAVTLFESDANRLQKPASGLANNVMFAFLEFNEIRHLPPVLSVVAQQVHKQPMSTATMGLFHLRKGNISKGKALYKEAVRLARDKKTKEKIGQKLNLELGRYYFAKQEYKKAQKYLTKALRVKGGLPLFAKETLSLLMTMQRKG